MRLTSRITSAGLTQTILPFLLVFLAGAIWTASPANAQPVRASDTFYLKFGAGLSDFAGDASGPDFGSNPNAPDVPGPINGLRDLFDTEKFSDGGPFPYALSGEVGYHFSPSASVGLGYQFGQYPFVHGRPLTVRDDFPGAGGDLGTIRHTVQLLGRYMVKAEAWTLSPYFDTGLNLSFGGRNTAVGPLAGIGLDVSVSGRTSLFLESRINITFSDEAIDGVEGGGLPDALSALPSLGLRVCLADALWPATSWISRKKLSALAR